MSAPFGVRWKEMVGQTALDMCAKGHELELDPDFKLMKTSYFGPSTAGQGPSTMAWRPSAT